MMLLLAITVESLYYDCGPTRPISKGRACSGHKYRHCVTELVKALSEGTPNTKNFIHSGSYPRAGASGGVTGTAVCVYSYGSAACRDCLVEAHRWLDTSCAFYANGTYGTEGCSMSFTQIP
ncbi:hypothetical protein LINGRAHAP2_LOCUS34022 [Linum grandiflorum]